MLDVSSILSTCDSYFSSSKFLLQMFSAEENDDEWIAKQANLLISLICCFFFILRHSVATIPNINVLWFACCKNSTWCSKTRFSYFFTVGTSSYTIELLEFNKFSWPILLKLYCIYAIKYAIFLFANKHYVILNYLDSRKNNKLP